MPKPKNSPPPPLKPTIVSSQEDRAACAKLAAGFSFVTDKGSTASLSVERAEALAMKRVDRLSSLAMKHRDIRARALEVMRDGRARRRYLREARAADRAIERFWRRFFAKPRALQRRPAPATRKRRNVAGPAGSTKLPSYLGPIIDRMGRQSVFLAVRYYGAKRSKVGVARRLVLYITRPDALERDDEGKPVIVANIGEDVAEQATAFDLVETLARSGRGNAKIIFSMVLNLPHDIGQRARRDILERFCAEAFDLHDLPYVATIHTPPPEGDARNYHAHIVFALRPMHRTGDHQWDVASRLATEFDGEERFTYLRALFAQTMTEVVQEAGKKRVYTHLSNAARGLRALPLTALGPALTQAVRDGDVVGANEHNRRQIEVNEALLLRERERWRAERSASRDAIDRQYQPAQINLPRLALPAVPASVPLPAVSTRRTRLPGSPGYTAGRLDRTASALPTAPTAARIVNDIVRSPLTPPGQWDDGASRGGPLPDVAALPSKLRQRTKPLPACQVDGVVSGVLSQRIARILHLIEEAITRRNERTATKRREAAKRHRPAAPDIADE